MKKAQTIFDSVKFLRTAISAAIAWEKELSESRRKREKRAAELGEVMNPAYEQEATHELDIRTGQLEPLDDGRRDVRFSAERELQERKARLPLVPRKGHQYTAEGIREATE